MLTGDAERRRIVAVVRHSYTYSDLADMPDDGQRYEIVDGDLVVSPSPTPRHQFIVVKLVQFLSQAEFGGFGRVAVAPLDVVLDAHNVAQPDVLFITTSRLDIVTDRHVQGAPDLVVEVLSPTTRSHDLGTKLRLYAQYGVISYWIVDPEAQTVGTYDLHDSEYTSSPSLTVDDLLSSPLFPGITIAVRDLFV